MPPDTQNQNVKLPPPSGSPKLASKYIDWLTGLISKNRLTLSRSDLSKFEVSCMEEHYRIDLSQYDVEISHSKHPKSGEDIYTMIFNNLTQLGENRDLQRVILAFIHLDKKQFEQFKDAADSQIQRKWQEEEEKRFKDVMAPVDQLLKQAEGTDEKVEKIAEPEVPKIEQSAPLTDLPEPMKLPPIPDSPAFEEPKTLTSYAMDSQINSPVETTTEPAVEMDSNPNQFQTIPATV